MIKTLDVNSVHMSVCGLGFLGVIDLRHQPLSYIINQNRTHGNCVYDISFSDRHKPRMMFILGKICSVDGATKKGPPTGSPY